MESRRTRSRNGRGREELKRNDEASKAMRKTEGVKHILPNADRGYSENHVHTKKDPMENFHRVPMRIKIFLRCIPPKIKIRQATVRTSLPKPPGIVPDDQKARPCL